MTTLQDFVRETLREIVEGIREAQQLPDVSGQVAPSGIGSMKFPPESGVYFEARILATTVKFDVAVTAETKERGELGGGLKVMVLSARAGTEATMTDTTVSRVQFAVPLVFPRNNQSWNASPRSAE